MAPPQTSGPKSPPRLRTSNTALLAPLCSQQTQLSYEIGGLWYGVQALKFNQLNVTLDPVFSFFYPVFPS